MVYMYHSFLIHSSADGHLGCFHVLAMINSAVMNIGVHMSLSDLLSFLYGSTYTSIHDYWKKHTFDYLNLCRQSNVSAFYILSRLVMAFLPRRKCLLI